MSLAISRFVLTVLAASPPGSGGPSEVPVVTWSPEAIHQDAAATREVSGEPKPAQLDGLSGLTFDGVDDALIVASNPLAGASSFTIEALIAPEAGGPEAQRFLHIEDETGRRVLLELRLGSDDTWSLDSFIYENAENRCVLLDRVKTHPTGKWHWVALRFDSGIMSHFVDGVPQGEGNVAFQSMVSGRTSLGVRLNRVSWYKGLIREVRFHPSALAVDKLQRR